MTRLAPGASRPFAISVLLAITSLVVMTVALLDHRPNVWIYTAINGVLALAVGALLLRVVRIQFRDTPPTK